MRRIKLLPIIFLMITIIASCNSSASVGNRIGDMAYDFTLKSIDGKNFSLSDFRGKEAVMLVFWTTWCPNCRIEIPRLKSIYKKYAGKGMSIISINVGVNDSIKKAEKYKKKHEIPYPVLFDKGQSVTRKYNIRGVPGIVIVDINGKIKYIASSVPGDLDKHFDELAK